MNRIIKSIVHIDPVPLLASSGILLFMFGSWLLMPSNTFAAGKIYSIMASVADENVWGLTMAAVGLFQFLSLRYKKLSVVSAIASLLMSLFVAVSFILSGTQTAGIGTFVAYSIISAWALIALLSRR